jgi:hypothetical protein
MDHSSKQTLPDVKEMILMFAQISTHCTWHSSPSPTVLPFTKEAQLSESKLLIL